MDSTAGTYSDFTNVCLNGCSCYVAKVHDGTGYEGNLDKVRSEKGLRCQPWQLF